MAGRRPGAAVLLLAAWAIAGPALAARDNGPAHDEPRFEPVRGSDELRDPRIWDIVRDRVGFMWFATFSGVVRYDGFEYRWFVSDPQDESSLSDNRIRSLLTDSDGAVWASTWDVGLNRFDPETGRFTRYRHDPGSADSLDDDRVRSMYEDRAGYLWVGTMSGLNRIDRRTGRVVRYSHVSSEAGKVYSVQALTDDEQGNLWVGVYDLGLVHLSPDGQVLARYRYDPARPDSLSDNKVVRLTFDDSGTLWVGTWGGGLNAFDQDTGTFRVYRHDPADDTSIPDDELLNMWSDARGVWVIPLEGPLARLDPDTGRFARYRHDPSRVGSPPQSLSGAAFEDVHGSLWLGTYGDGAEVWHPGKPRLTHYRKTPGSDGGLSDDLVQSVLEGRRGVVWVGTRRGLNRLDPATGQITAYQPEPANPNSLSADYVETLYEDRDGILWVGTWGGGLNRFDTESGTFRRYPCGTADPHALSECDVWSMLEDRAGRLWIGTYDGLNELDRRSGRVARYSSRPGDSSSLSGGAITTLAEAPDGTLWVGTNNGFNRFVPESRTFVRYGYNPSDTTGLAHPQIGAICPLPDGSLWLGTGGGLQLVEWDDAGSPHYTLYAERVGLPRFSVRGILTNGSGELWITTFGHGLWSFDPASGQAAHFDATDGLLKGYDGPGWRMTDGRLLLGGIDGVVIFDPSPMVTPSWAPPIVITDVAVDNESIPWIDTAWHQVTDEPTITLRPENRSITFRFAALDYEAPARSRFRYRLDRYDADWKDTGALERQATYTNLKPGTYHFRVIGAGSAGIWNDAGSSVQLTVLPAWWQTAWFKGLSFLAGVTLLLTIHRLRLKYVVDAHGRLAAEVEHRRKAEQEIRHLAGRLITAQEEERSHVARDLHDGVGQQAASFSIGLSRVKRKVPSDAAEALGEISGLQEQAKRLSGDLRRISHRLHPSMLEHLGLLRSLRSRCQEFGLETGVPARLDVADTWPLLPDVVALCLYRVAQEALRNVAAHARATQVTVSLDRRDDHLVMTIADDGCGFDPQTPSDRPGLGLVSMQERVRAIGGRFDVATRPGAGTKISVSLRIGEADAAQSTPR